MRRCSLGRRRASGDHGVAAVSAGSIYIYFTLLLPSSVSRSICTVDRSPFAPGPRFAVASMVIPSRWKVDIPRCSLQQWIFGSANEPLAEYKAIMDADNPENNFLTLEQFRLLAKRVALGLLAEGFAPGDRVLLFTGNNVYFPSVFLGILMAGGVFTGANPGFVPRELAYQLRDSGARFMLVAEKALGTALEAAAEAGLPRSSIFVLGADEPAPQIATSRRPGRGQAGREDGVRHWTELLADNAGQARTWSWKEPADPETTTCAINYSSGTTGVPKGVEISHYSYVANGVGVEAMDELNPDWADRRRRSRGLCYLP